MVVRVVFSGWTVCVFLYKLIYIDHFMSDVDFNRSRHQLYSCTRRQPALWRELSEDALMFIDVNVLLIGSF